MPSALWAGWREIRRLSGRTNKRKLGIRCGVQPSGSPAGRVQPEPKRHYMPRKYSSDNPHPVDLYVASRLKRRRIENGLSQQSLAALIGLSYQQLQKNERGENRISASMMYELGRALHVEPGYFSMVTAKLIPSLPNQTIHLFPQGGRASITTFHQTPDGHS